MAVASVSGHFSSSRPYGSSLPHCFSPRRLISAPRTTRWRCPQTRTCWAWGSRRWGAPAPCPTTATCSSHHAAGTAPPAWPRGLQPTTRPSQVQSCDRRGWGGPSEPVGGSKLPLVLRKVLRGLDVWNGFAKPPRQVAKMMLKGLLLSSELGGGTGSCWPGWSCPGMVTVSKAQAPSILPRLIVVQEQKSQQNNISLCPFYFFAVVPAVEVLEALHGNICEKRENSVSKCL